jgi:ankyrin repeat protein
LAQASEPEGTPDVIDITEITPSPESVEAPGTLSEMERNLIQSAYSGDLAKVKVLVSKGANVNVREQKKRTPLIFAATNGHTSIVEFLINKGAEVNARDSSGQTALIYAAKRSFNETAAVLLKNGAEVNVKSKKKGITALMLAAVWDNEELVKMLLKHGADPQLADTFGRTAKILAEKKGNSDVVGLLSEPPV